MLFGSIRKDAGGWEKDEGAGVFCFIVTLAAWGSWVKAEGAEARKENVTPDSGIYRTPVQELIPHDKPTLRFNLAP